MLRPLKPYKTPSDEALALFEEGSVKHSYLFNSTLKLKSTARVRVVGSRGTAKIRAIRK